MPVSAGAGAPSERTLGKYALLGLLAEGGMGEILLARLDGAAGFEKYVVIKRLRRHLDRDQPSIRAFLDEARIVARISHPNVCQVHELGVEDGRYYLAMEYLEGLPLSGIIRRASRDRTPLDLRAVGAMIEQACEGLHHAHTLRRIDGAPASVLHRDVSPQNLFVTVGGVVKVLDFGIAKSGDSSVKTPIGRIKGKSAYMSPEQIRGAPLDPRSDVYSLGVVLYEAITGEPLFERGDVAETFRAIREDTLPALRHVPAELNGVVQQAVSRERADRFDSARAFGRALGAALARLGGSMTVPELAEWLAERFADDLGERRERAAQAAAGRAGAVDGERRLGPGTVILASQDAPASPSALEVIERLERDGGTEPLGGTSTRDLIPTARLQPSGTMPLAAQSDELWSEPALIPADQIAPAGPDARAPDPAPSDRRPDPAPASHRPASRRMWPWVAVGAAVAGALVLALAARADRDGPAPRGETTPVSTSGDTGDSTPPEAAPSNVAALEPTDPPPAPTADPGAADGSIGPGAADASAAWVVDRMPDAGPDDGAADDERAPRPVRRSRARGYFTVDSAPYATITIDGQVKGITPLLKIPLSPGMHSVVAVTYDGRRRTFRIRIEPGVEAPRRLLVW